MFLLGVRGCRFPSLGFALRSSKIDTAGTAALLLCTRRSVSRRNTGTIVGGARGLSSPELGRNGEARAQQQALWPRNKITFPYVKCVSCFSTSSSSGNASDGKLVYIGNLARAVLGVKFFSYSTSIFNLCVMPYIAFKSGAGMESMTLQIAFYSIIGFFTFVTPVAMHLVTKGYVVRLYHRAKTDTYTAVTYSVLLTEKRTAFHQKDVKVPGVSKMFTTFYAQDKSMLVNPMLFSNPHDYSHLMGYDKPFTFDLEELKDASENKVSQQ
ncbi:transmembrane protein 70, mitochondrial [Rhinatrema bivittatum]|uniref:transmembrane protein 70, mitochondrial n=1 Tax=Rhinatrema bivittatum TaxID=194408 RepID=UPI00112B4CAF|nr:transmembrane protein 70, mitochondrial [Rhinatrema bivittatum]